MGDELAALAVPEGGGDAHLDAELVRPMGFALADAFDFRRMQGILLINKSNEIGTPFCLSMDE
jgi:hypothetical protein